MQHPMVHRLTRIKQLGLTCYVYPGAQHTRFQHSLGALFLMTEAIKTLQNKGNDITPEEAEAVYAAIFLHDVGHGPFSHTLEEFFYKDISHEDIGIAIIEKLNEEFNGKLSLTIEILKNTYHKKFLHELVSGQLDMDRLDYLRRDSFFTGVSEGNIGSARIIKMLNIKDGKLVVEAKGIYSIENFLMSRRLMYWQVYLHKTAFAAEMMLCKTLERARYLVQKGENIFASENLMYFLKQQQEKITAENLSIFTTLDDTDIWVSMKAWERHSDKVLSTLSSGIINRSIFKLEISNESIPAEVQNKKLEEIQNKWNLSREDADFLVAQKTVSNHLYSRGEMGIDILYSDGSTKSISQASDMFNLDLLSKKVSKCYFCYVRGL
jgi:HD superfamily phosphohydrolase